MTDRKNSFDLLYYFLKRYPGQSITVIGALLLAGFAETLGVSALLPLLNIIMGDGAASEDNLLYSLTSGFFNLLNMTPTIETLLFIIVILIFFKAVVLFFAMRYAGFVAADITRIFQLRLIRSLLQAQWPYFSGLSTGVVANAIATESQRAGHSYMLAGKLLAALFQAIIYLAAAFLILWKLSLLAIVLGGLLAYFIKGIIAMARKSGVELSQTMDGLLARLGDSIAGAKPLKAMGQEDRYFSRLEVDTGLVVNARKRQYVSALLMQVVYEPVIVLCLAIGLYYVIVHADVPVTEVLLLALLFQRLMSYIALAQNHYQNMVQNESAVWSLERQIIEADGEREILTQGSVASLNQAIDISGVTIGYGSASPILKDFTASIPARKLTVVFGPSGAGKTTLTDAIIGLLPLREGSIKLDSTDIRKIDLAAWRRKVGYVPQESFLFHDTVRSNITLGDQNFSDTEILDALGKASAQDFVMALPGGLDFVVGERGGKLSGGQRQRLALARAIIRKPELLILDEPTSALDADNHELIAKVIKNLSREITVVLVSHDQSLKNIADNIIVLDGK